MREATVRLGVITEVHIVPPGTPEGVWHNPFLFDQAEELFGRAVQRCVDAGVDAIAILGDLTHFADAGSFAGVRRVLERVTLPVYVLPGNHDLDATGEPLGGFRQALDLPGVVTAPATGTLAPGIGLELVSLERGPGETGYSAVRADSGSGEATGLTVVLTHFPVYAMKPLLTDAELKHAGDLVNREGLQAGIGEIEGPVLVVNGHLHVHATVPDGRVLQLSVAALIEPPHDVTLLSIGFDEAGNPWVTRAASGLFEAPGVRLPVLSDREERWHVVEGVWQAA